MRVALVYTNIGWLWRRRSHTAKDSRCAHLKKNVNVCVRLHVTKPFILMYLSNKTLIFILLTVILFEARKACSFDWGFKALLVLLEKSFLLLDTSFIKGGSTLEYYATTCRNPYQSKILEKGESYDFWEMQTFRQVSLCLTYNLLHLKGLIRGI